MLRRWKLTSGWEDVSKLSDLLERVGLSAGEAARKAEIFCAAAAAIPLGVPRLAFYVPGRVEVLGKHTDYAGGESIVAAVERGFCLVAFPRSDKRLFLTNVDSAETVAVELSPEISPVRGHWVNYAMTVARRVARNFPEISVGVDLAFGSDLPPAAGMSSSSALIVAIFLALAEVNRLWETERWQENIRIGEDLAGYLATVENGQSFGSLEGDVGVGTHGGSEDHIAILLARPRELLRYLYSPVRFIESIPLPPNWVFAIATSGVVAEKTGTALEHYNAASFRARKLAELWQESTGGKETTLGAIAGLGPEAVAQLRSIVTEHIRDESERAALLSRLEHFVLENQEILPHAARALREGDFVRFGELVDRSQWGAEHLLGNQVPETIFLAKVARQLGAVAASAFGAGFGGAVWALVTCDEVNQFLGKWQEAYEGAFPYRASQAQFFSTRPGPAAFLLEL